MWCGDCYTPHPLDTFFIHLPHDEAGFVWQREVDFNRYKVGRAGNHIVTTFQCDRCVFLNLLH